eukprot:6183182-Pleurochrysis_carterae.AAC.4
MGWYIVKYHDTTSLVAYTGRCWLTACGGYIESVRERGTFFSMRSLGKRACVGGPRFRYYLGMGRAERRRPCGRKGGAPARLMSGQADRIVRGGKICTVRVAWILEESRWADTSSCPITNDEFRSSHRCRYWKHSYW